MLQGRHFSIQYELLVVTRLKWKRNAFTLYDIESSRNCQRRIKKIAFFGTSRSFDFQE